MNTWSAGYVADINYTYGYYGELSPSRIQQAFLHAGLAPPAVATACELGFGQGLSTAIHAAASATEWYGTDFNPAQACFAQELAAVSGSGAQLFDQAFGEFCVRDDLPDFDFIALHGIWSWISDDNRRVIVDFVRRKLKVGGVLYISYNTEPGWSSMVPMRRLMAAHSQVMSAPGTPMSEKVERALEFAERLMATNPALARANPHLAARLEMIKAQPRSYLAHEYFNQDWDPMAFSTIADWLAPAKLSYACPAHLPDHIAKLHLTQEQNRLLAETPDQVLRESMRDFMVNQIFRRDYWVRGARRLSRTDYLEAVGRLRVALVRPRSDVTLRIKGALGEAELHPAVYDTILDVLSDYRPRSIVQLEQQLAGKVETRALLEAVTILSGKGDLALFQDERITARARPRCDKLNAYLIGKARSSDDVQHLASPVTGGAVQLNRFEQLFLLGRMQGKKSAAEFAALAARALKAEGQHMLKDGQPVVDEQETLSLLTRQATDFEARIPILRTLGIVA